MPPHPAVFLITPHAIRDNLPTPLTVPYTYDRIVSRLRRRGLIVRLLEIRAQLHQRARREGIIRRKRFLKEALVLQRDEDFVGFLDRYAGVLRLAFALFGIGLALARAPDARQLTRFRVPDGHDFARVRVVSFEHVVEQAADVGDFRGGESCGELGEGV